MKTNYDFQKALTRGITSILSENEVYFIERDISDSETLICFCVLTQNTENVWFISIHHQSNQKVLRLSAVTLGSDAFRIFSKAVSEKNKLAAEVLIMMLGNCTDTVIPNRYTSLSTLNDTVNELLADIESFTHDVTEVLELRNMAYWKFELLDEDGEDGNVEHAIDVLLNVIESSQDWQMPF